MRRWFSSFLLVFACFAFIYSALVGLGIVAPPSYRAVAFYAIWAWAITLAQIATGDKS